MKFRSVAGLVGALMITGLLAADEFRGAITKIEDGSITVKSGGFGGFGGKGKKTEAEEKTFKVGKDVKISRTFGKDKEKDDVKLTLDELKTAVKVTNVTVTVTY